MKRFDAILMVVVLLELSIGAILFSLRETPRRPPVPMLGKSHPIRKDFEAMAANCKGPEDWRNLAEVYTAYGFYSEAEACYDYLLSAQPQDPQLLFESGFVISRVGRWEDANARFRAAIDAGHPNSIDCWYLIGRNLLRGEQPEEAARAFSQAGTYLITQYELARLRYRAGDAERAMTLLQPVLAQESDKIEPNALAYLCSLELEDLQAATKFSEQAADTPERLFTPFNTQWLRTNEVIPLIGYRRRFAEAEDLSAQNQPDLAEALLMEGLEVEWNQFSLAFLAKLIASRGDHQRAIALLQEIIDRRGPSTEWLAKMADYYAESKDLSRAIETMNQAVEAQSEEDLTAAFEKLASWSESLGRQDEARRYADLHKLWTGKVAFWNAEWKKAEYYLDSASKQIEGSEEAWFFLAETRRRLKKNTEARTAYKHCLSLNPLHGGAQRGISILAEK